MDLEGVLVPEIWIAFAEKTGIPELRLTTRDVADYHELMQHRLRILKEHNLKLQDIQKVIATMRPLPGAKEYMEWLSARHPNVIISDTFYEFAMPLMKQLGYPTLFCNNLEVAADGAVTGYKQRLLDGKRHAALAFKQLNFRVVAMGDSYNDTAMLTEAHLGLLFRPSDKVRAQFPQFPVVNEYSEIQNYITEFDRG
ncbi:MAG: bifunctional phosphoserine phosphatase/homoserine phosphotransferase ThrH [Victivallales bacterium]|nr:bifunctional phosphoserine phosphatase/homoserine phosphotransferase ThrH [Victivallales bacterium]